MDDIMSVFNSIHIYIYISSIDSDLVILGGLSD